MVCLFLFSRCLGEKRKKKSRSAFLILFCAVKKNYAIFRNKGANGESKYLVQKFPLKLILKESK